MLNKATMAVVAALLFGSASAAVADIDTDVNLYRGTMTQTYYSPQASANSALTAQARFDSRQKVPARNLAESFVW